MRGAVLATDVDEGEQLLPAVGGVQLAVEEGKGELGEHCVRDGR